MSAEARLFVKPFVTNGTKMGFLFGVLFPMKNDRVSVREPGNETKIATLRGNIFQFKTICIKIFPNLHSVTELARKGPSLSMGDHVLLQI